MGLRGRAPKPQAVRKLEGDRKRRNRREPKFLVTHLRPPSWLPKFAVEEWERVVPALERISMLTEDAPAPHGLLTPFGFRLSFPTTFSDSSGPWVGGFGTCGGRRATRRKI